MIFNDEKYERPTEVDALIGDPTKAHDVLGWKAQTDVGALARLMVDADVAALGDGLGAGPVAGLS